MRFVLYCIFSPMLSLMYATLTWAEEEDTPLQLVNPQQTGQVDMSAPTGMHDIYLPIPTPEPVPYLLYGLLGLAVLLLLAGIYWWFFRRPRPLPPPIPPAMIARDELMRARELMTPEQAIPYMERVSGILRRYLESRFTLPTTRQTTRELILDLARGQHAQFAPLARFQTELRSCLELCDLAKFAHRSAGLEPMQQMEEQVLNFVNSTEDEPHGGDK